MTDALGPLIAERARTWLQTPFVHQGRVKGRDGGVDCVGLLVGIARELGLKHEDVVGYSAQPHAGLCEREARRQMERKPIQEVEAGDVILFRVDRDPQHFGVVTAKTPEVYFVHSFSKIGMVVENRLDDFWRRRVVAVYVFPRESA